MTGRLSARVLCVDDNPDIAFSTAALLEAVGFEVRTATSGEAALDVAREFRPDACVLDIAMPGMTGYDLAPRLKALLGTVFLVAVTGTYGGEHDRRLVEAGFNFRLIKPADPMALLTAVQRGIPVPA